MNERGPSGRTLAPLPFSALLTPLPEAPNDADAVREFLGFQLGAESYAVPLRTVREILKPPPITEVPRAPRYVLGIVSVRGRVTTVLDLRRRLRTIERPIDRQTRVLLVDSGTEVIGLLVDCVLQVFRFEDSDIEHAAAVSGGVRDYVLGIGRPRALRGGRDAVVPELLILLDLVHLLRSQ